MSGTPGELLPVAAALPALPPRLPRRRPDPAWLRALARRLLRGWTWTGGFPDLDRVLVIAWPHTSNRDGFVGLAALVELGLDLRAFGKKELFRPPLAGLLRHLGVIPVDRHAAGGVVARAAEQFAAGPLVLGLAPEGTRRRGIAWRTGWHRIAVEAGVPVAVVGLDWGRRRLGVLGTFVPSGDYETDARTAEALLAGVVGHTPENATPALAPTAG